MKDLDRGPISAFPLTAEIQPSEGYERAFYVQKGMTLRDYFAAAALQGMLAQCQGMATGNDPVYHARWAYQQADAMMKERDK